MEHLTGPIIGLMFLQRNHTVLDMRQRILKFPFFPMQLKTADPNYSKALEPILNPTEITIRPNDRVLNRTNSLLYPENAVTGFLQPSDLLHEEGDITFCPALVTLKDGNLSIHVNNFTDHPYKLKKGLHIASFSVMTPEQMKYVKPVDPASTWHLLQNDQEQAAHCVSSLIKTNKNPQTLKITSSQLQKTLEIPRNTRLSRNEFYVNYRHYRTWRHSTPPKMNNLAQKSQKTSIGKIPLLPLRERRKLKITSGIPRYICTTQI